MDFFHSLSLDLKLLVIGIAGCALLALFSGNPKTEKKYLLVLALLTAAGVYRFNHTIRSNEQAEAAAAAARAAVPVAAPPPKRAPLSSTAAK